MRGMFSLLLMNELHDIMASATQWGRDARTQIDASLE
jgi:hypothetical protein